MSYDDLYRLLPVSDGRHEQLVSADGRVIGTLDAEAMPVVVRALNAVPHLVSRAETTEKKYDFLVRSSPDARLAAARHLEAQAAEAEKLRVLHARVAELEALLPNAAAWIESLEQQARARIVDEENGIADEFDKARAAAARLRAEVAGGGPKSSVSDAEHLRDLTDENKRLRHQIGQLAASKNEGVCSVDFTPTEGGVRITLCYALGDEMAAWHAVAAVLKASGATVQTTSPPERTGSTRHDDTTGGAA